MNLCRWLKGLNVSMASEGKQRVMAMEIVGDNLAAERGAFTFSQGKGGGEVVKEAPFVYCPNLIARVAEHNKRQALTTNHYHTYSTCNNDLRLGLLVVLHGTKVLSLLKSCG